MNLCEAGSRYSAELLPYLDEGSLLTLRREVENLRRALLGVQMGRCTGTSPPKWWMRCCRPARFR